MKKSAVLLALLAGCGDNVKAEAPDAAVDAPPPFAEATPTSMPQLITLGGPVLAQPKVQPIFWASDPLQAQVEQFLTQLGPSPYWSATTAEYGVGPISVLPTILATGAPPATDDALPAWLTAHVPTADPNTIYAVFLGDGVVLGGQGGNSCDAYGAYHDETVDSHNQPLIYALMPRCNPATQFDHAQTKLDELLMSTSHELIEAVTDPRVETAPAFGDIDNDHAVLSIVPGAETGDLCEYIDSAYIKGVGDFMVQRTWSNAAAKAGHDPCVPAPATAYFAAAPVFTEAVQIDGFTGTRTTKAMQLALHASKTIEVDLYSDQPTAAYEVTADDQGAGELSFQWDTATGKNGDKLHLTITRTKAASGGNTGSVFTVSTATPTGMVSQWWGYVAN